MKTIEKDLLQHSITDRLFAEYLTPRIDIGDSDEDTVNRIHELRTRPMRRLLTCFAMSTEFRLIGNSYLESMHL